MNAQALVGKVLGNCRLLKVIGRGSMGAVYLAQQTRAYDQGQVAVKVFLGASTLEPLPYMDFLVRFRHEMDAVAALDHPTFYRYMTMASMTVSSTSSCLM